MGNLIFDFRNSADEVVSAYYMPKGLIIAIACIVLAITILFYVFRGIALYKLAKKAGIKHAGMAWVPFLWVIILGKLCGRVGFFGKVFNKFYIFAFIVVLINGLIEIATGAIVYIPTALHLLRGGNVTVTSMTTISTDPNIFTYGAKVATMVLGYIQDVTSILEIVALITLYFAFFKKYWPQRFTIASFLSIFGLFPIFAFVVRKKDPIDYQAWARARYQAFIQQNPHFNNPYGNPYAGPQQNPTPSQQPEQKSPFEEYENKKDDDPFSEFNSDKD